MKDIIIAVIVVAIIGLALWYVIRAKSKGNKCIGCPSGCCCEKKNGKASCCCNNENN